eukprot:4396453-Ditylum_brightwellii.AAC.1
MVSIKDKTNHLYAVAVVTTKKFEHWPTKGPCLKPTVKSGAVAQIRLLLLQGQDQEGDGGVPKVWNSQIREDS